MIKLRASTVSKLKKALEKAGKLIANETTSNFVATGVSNSLAKGIGYKLLRKGLGVYVGLLGDFRLRFFEGGTKKRFAKYIVKKANKKMGLNAGQRARRYTGQIKAHYFFKKAMTSKYPEAADRIIKVIQNNDLFDDFTLRLRGRITL